MAIRNKDGTVYKLRGPNPLMDTQSQWDAAHVKLINCGWKGEVIEDKNKGVPNVINIRDELGLKDNPPTKAVPGRSFIKEIMESPDPVVVAKPEKPREPEPVVLNVDPRLARVLKERGVEFFCAPAVGTKKHTDNLYGESYETTVYGDKYMFDAVVLDHSDLQLQFWCVRPVTLHSVVLRKDKEGGERWWRVNEVAPKTGGYLAKCITSDSNPDFS